MHRTCWQTPAPVASKADDCFTVSGDKSFSLRLSSPSQGFLNLRFLLTKFYARGQGLDQNEEILLDLILQYFHELRNDKFTSNFRSDDYAVLSLAKLFITFRSREYPSWALAQIAILRKSKSLMSPRAFLGFEKTFSVRKLIKRKNRRLNSRPPPLAYIGVGYRDKGAAKVVHHDGSPSWSDVAMELARDLPYDRFTSNDRSPFLSVTTFKLCCPKNDG